MIYQIFLLAIANVVPDTDLSIFTLSINCAIVYSKIAISITYLKGI